MGQFEELYQALQIPREDIHAAWTLVNVHSAPQIGKEQCIMFFHILNSRRLGKRVPSTLPGALRTSFLGDSNYALSDNYSVNEIRQQPGRPSVPMSFVTKSAFSSEKGHAMAGDYLSRLNQKDQAAHGKPFALFCRVRASVLKHRHADYFFPDLSFLCFDMNRNDGTRRPIEARARDY